MNSILAIIITSIFFIASGWNISHLISKIEKVERVGLSFLLGAGLTTFIWFQGYSLVGLSLNLITLFCSGLILAVLGLFLRKILHLKLDIDKTIKFGRTEKILVLTLMITLLIALIIGSYNPLTAWDSIALYDFRGHAIALDHDLSFGRVGAYFMSYPLMISLVHAIVYMLGGISAQGIHSIIFAAFIGIVFGRLKSWTNTIHALIGSLLIIGQNEIFTHSTIAYTNLPYTSYLIVGFLYAISSGSYAILLSGIMLAISTWVRSSEVFWIIGIILIIWQGLKTKQKLQTIISIITILAFRYAWSTYLSAYFASVSFITESTASHFTLKSLYRIISNWREIYWYLYLNVISPYLGVWSLSIPSLVVVIMKRNIRLFMLTSAILLSAGIVVVGVMVFSTYYITWNEIGDSARRMMLFIVPLSIITATYALYISSNKNNEK